MSATIPQGQTARTPLEVFRAINSTMGWTHTLALVACMTLGLVGTPRPEAFPAPPAGSSFCRCRCRCLLGLLFGAGVADATF